MAKDKLTIYEKMIRKLKIDYKSSYSSSEMIMNCPDKGCPNPHNHLYMNKKTGLFICHRCGLAGNAITFLTIVKRINYKEARAILASEEVPTGTSLDALKLRAAEVATIEDQLYLLEDGKGLKNIIPPPREAIPISKGKYPAYLKKRRVPFYVAKTLNVMFCNSGRYVSRIIFPFSCSGHKSFVAYATNKSAKKTMNPPGSYNRDLLFGYDVTHKLRNDIINLFGKQSPKYKGLVVVEGIFDFIRLTIYGYYCVALLKSFLSKNQAILLNDIDMNPITFMLDGDVTDDELVKKLRFINFIEGKDIQIARIPYKTHDPDMLSPEEVARIIRRSAKNASYFSQLKERAKKLKKYAL